VGGRAPETGDGKGSTQQPGDNNLAKRGGLIDLKVDPDTGEYLNIVGSQRDIRYNTEAAPEDTSESDDTEDLPPEDRRPA
jgi:hypothetical protein